MFDSPIPQTWELTSILPHPETAEFQTILVDYKRRLSELATASQTLPALSPMNRAAWWQLLSDDESTEKLALDLATFVGCLAAADAGNKLYQQLEAELSACDPLRSQVATAIEFAVKEATNTPEGARDFEEFLEGDARLKRLQFFFDEQRLNAELRLPKAQEELANDLAVDAIHAWGRLYDRLSGELRVEVMERGELIKKSPGQLNWDAPDRSVRENYFFAADKAWASIQDSCADALNHIAGFRLTKYRHLGLSDHLQAPLRFNRMRSETLTAMWNAVTARKPALLRYLQIKARFLGVERLAWYDIDVPLPVTNSADAIKTVTYDDACRTVVQTFRQFSPDFGDFAEMAIRERWIEVENRPGKRQGGFCADLPTSKQSRIFMTWTNSIDSMSTLAHELGHAYHSHVLRDEPYFLQGYPMNLAETASTFAEAVLAEQQLQAAKTPGDELKLLDTMLSSAVAFLMNIHARFLFEDRFHHERRSGEVSAERLSELMLTAQKEAYLDALADGGWDARFWVSKLHFYISGLPFYNFPYTFGYLLSLGTFALAKSFSANEFPQRYRQLLIATGCQATEEAVLSTLGEDLTQPDFWHKSLDIVEQRVTRFEQLAASVRAENQKG